MKKKIQHMAVNNQEDEDCSVNAIYDAGHDFYIIMKNQEDPIRDERIKISEPNDKKANELARS